MVIGTFLPWLGGGTGFAASISAPQNAGGIDYNDKVPSVELVPVVVAPDLTVNADAGEVFSGGNIRFEIAEGSDPSEKLKLPEGQYTLEGGQVIDIIGGIIYMDSDGDGDHDDPGENIAKVNDTFNGDGKSLQIDFSTIPIPNGNFEAGSVGEISATNPIQNWKLNTSSTGPDGNPIDQIWLGPELATKTQGRTYDSVASNEDGTFTVTGPSGEYSYNTNVDYNGTSSYGDSQ